jgi:hypothetical protein
MHEQTFVDGYEHFAIWTQGNGSNVLAILKGKCTALVAAQVSRGYELSIIKLT